MEFLIPTNENLFHIHYIAPPLSYVAQPDYEMGEKAVELIIKEIKLNRENKSVKYETYVMETSLILRESIMGKDKKAPIT